MQCIRAILDTYWSDNLPWIRKNTLIALQCNRFRRTRVEIWKETPWGKPTISRYKHTRYYSVLMSLKKLGAIVW